MLAATPTLPIPGVPPAGTPSPPDVDSGTRMSVWGPMFRYGRTMMLSPLHVWTAVWHGIFRHNFERIGKLSQERGYMGIAGYGILYSAARVYPEAADVLRSYGHRLLYADATLEERAHAAARILHDVNANTLGWQTGYLMGWYFPSPDARYFRTRRTNNNEIVFEQTTHIGGRGETIREATLDEVCFDLQEIDLHRRIKLALSGYHYRIWELHDYAQIGSQQAYDSLTAVRKLEPSNHPSESNNVRILLARAGNGWAIWNSVNHCQPWWEPHATLENPII